MKKIVLIMFIIQMVVSVPLFACTGFFSSKDDMMLVGNNEDWYNPFTQFWVISGNKQEYGVIYFGFDDKAPQGGMNARAAPARGRTKLTIWNKRVITEIDVNFKP